LFIYKGIKCIFFYFFETLFHLHFPEGLLCCSFTFLKCTKLIEPVYALDWRQALVLEKAIHRVFFSVNNFGVYVAILKTFPKQKTCKILCCKTKSKICINFEKYCRCLHIFYLYITRIYFFAKKIWIHLILGNRYASE